MTKVANCGYPGCNSPLSNAALCVVCRAGVQCPRCGRCRRCSGDGRRQVARDQFHAAGKALAETVEKVKKTCETCGQTWILLHACPGRPS